MANTSSQEVFSFYTHLVKCPTDGFEWWTDSNSIQVELIYDSFGDPTDVSQEFRDFLEGDKTLEGFGVLVPALMLMWGGYYAEELCDHFLDYYRRQFGTHVVINGDRTKIACLPCYWSKLVPKIGSGPAKLERKYSNEKARPISNMYPCFRPGKPPEIVLGICYGGAGYPELRSYGRYDFPIENNQCAFDITEEFFDPNHSGGHHRHYRDKQFSLKRDAKFVVAFYVCRGARLVVSDERYNTMQHARDKHARSLYQQGALVVATVTDFQVKYGYASEVSDKLDSGQGWKAFIKLLRPKERARRNKNKRELKLDPRDGRAAEEDRLVIFLGAAESQHNSVSWSLDVRSTDIGRKSPGSHRLPFTFEIDLKLPENGIIVDITSWNHGFQLIRARHHYEKLYESVLTAPNTFGWPAFERPPKDYLLRRVLGTPREKEKWGAMRIKYPYKKFQVPPNFYDTTGGVDDCDVRRYIIQTPQTYKEPALAMIEHPIGLATSPHWTYQGNPATILPNNYPSWVPPFYPAVLDPDSGLLMYVEDKITKNENGKYILSSRPPTQEFEIRLATEEDAYPWFRADIEDHIEGANRIWTDRGMAGSSPTIRYGADGLKYVMFATDSVPMAMYYLHPCDDIEEKEMTEKEEKKRKKQKKEDEEERARA